MDVREQQLVHLERLDKELASRGFAVEAVSKISMPYLIVANAGTPQLNERVQCLRSEDGSWSFWWPWKQPIGSVDDLETVIGKIAVVLRPVDGDQ
jgi:hypothetical protein